MFATRNEVVGCNVLAELRGQVFKGSPHAPSVFLRHVRPWTSETMPIVWGHVATKIFISVWILVLIGILVIMLFYTLFNGWFLMTAIILLALLIPLSLNFKKLQLASFSIWNNNRWTVVECWIR
jgi:hypothetical protein